VTLHPDATVEISHRTHIMPDVDASLLRAAIAVARREHTVVWLTLADAECLAETIELAAAMIAVGEIVADVGAALRGVTR
jgi:hypothetical protein